MQFENFKKSDKEGRGRERERERETVWYIRWEVRGNERTNKARARPGVAVFSFRNAEHHVLARMPSTTLPCGDLVTTDLSSLPTIKQLHVAAAPRDRGWSESDHALHAAMHASLVVNPNRARAKTWGCPYWWRAPPAWWPQGRYRIWRGGVFRSRCVLIHTSSIVLWASGVYTEDKCNLSPTC
eukprot:SAG11_NODE_4895_length_1731_cov_3.250613_1_plen_183_part_00